MARLLACSLLVLVCASARAQAPDDDFVPAKLAYSVEPTPPKMQPGQRVEVVLTLDVDEHGQVTAIGIAQSGGAAFDEAALAAARRFAFRPARAHGRPVATRVTYRSHFVGPLRPEERIGEPLLGEVFARGERQAQAGVAVFVDDGAARAVTDDKGRFVIDGLTVGPHVVHVRGSDIVPYDEAVTTRLNLPTLVTLWVAVKPRYLSRVRGRSAVQDPVEQTITSDEAAHLPGTQGDALKAVQDLPGVARPPFNAGLLAVWGSPPGDTRVYADGVFIPTLYHFGGLRSTLNPSLVSSLTLIPGGYGVEHGRGLGGAIELETREPRSDGIHGFAQADLVDVSGMLEGNIGRRFSFAAAFRVSWLEYTLQAFTTGNVVRLEPKYWDYQLKLHFRASARDTLDFFAFGSDDVLLLSEVNPNDAIWQEYTQHTYFHRALLRWAHRFGSGASLVVTPSVGYDLPYNLSTTIGNADYTHQNGQLEWSLRAAVHVPLGKRLRVDAGVDYEGTRYSFDAVQNKSGLYREGDTGDFLGYTAPDTTGSVARDSYLLYTNHVAPFAALTIALFGQRLLVMPQLRLETMTFYGYPRTPSHFSTVAFAVEPRLAARLRLGAHVALQGSVGLYHQPPDSADFSRVFGNRSLTPESAMHYVAGVEVKVTPTLHVELQGFYKDLRNLVVRGRGVDDPPLVGGGVGRVFGGELLLRQELWRNFFGWISYTLSRSERRDHPGDPWRPFQYDQTHILTILGSYKLPWRLQVGLRFRYVTGNPYTPVVASYFDVNSYAYVPIYGAPYAGRLPAFHELDVRVDKTFEFNRWRLILYLDVQNVYDATSAEGVTWSFDYKRVTYLNGVPFLPVFGARGEF